MNFRRPESSHWTISHVGACIFHACMFKNAHSVARMHAGAANHFKPRLPPNSWHSYGLPKACGRICFEKEKSFSRSTANMWPPTTLVASANSLASSNVRTAPRYLFSLLTGKKRRMLREATWPPLALGKLFILLLTVFSRGTHIILLNRCKTVALLPRQQVLGP